MTYEIVNGKVQLVHKVWPAYYAVYIVLIILAFEVVAELYFNYKFTFANRCFIFICNIIISILFICRMDYFFSIYDYKAYSFVLCVVLLLSMCIYYFVRYIIFRKK